jgi:hypothetical protein
MVGQGARSGPSAILRCTFNAASGGSPSTASGTGAPGRETSIQEPSRLALGWPILAILLVGLVVRLIMAYGIDGLRGSGFDSDLNLFRFWADNLATQGPYGFYDRGFFADYTPGYLYACGWSASWATRPAASVT